MAYQPKHMRLSAESSDGTLSEETLSKALDQTFDEPPVVDTIVVPETFHQPIEDEAFEQIVSQKLEEVAAEEDNSEADNSSVSDGNFDAGNSYSEEASSDEEDASKQKDLSRSTSMMSILVLISRITGFLRTWAQAFAMGATVLASCYSIANTLPDQLYELVGAGMLTTAFLPVYLSIKKKVGQDEANAYTSNLLSIVVVATGLVAVLGFFFAAEVVYTQSFSAGADFDPTLAVYFFRFFVIEVMLYCFSTIFSGVLNAERDYLWPAAAPIFNNFVTTASFFAYAFLVNTNPELGLLILALGNPLGVLIQVLIQVPSLKRKGIKLSWRINLKDPALKETLKIGAPALIVVVATFVTMSVQTSSQLSVSASGASIAAYARLWYTLPYSILTVPITTALFTELSDSWAKENMDQFKKDFKHGINQILFFTVPFMMYLMIFSMPLVSIIGASKFTEDQLLLTQQFLIGQSLALPLYGIGMYLQKVCSAMRRMTLYAVSATLGSVVQVLVLLVGTSHFGMMFVATTSAIFYVVIDTIMLISLRKHLGQIGLKSMVFAFVRSILFGLAGSAAALLIMVGLRAVIGVPDGRALYGVLYCIFAGIPAVLVTYGLAILFKSPESAMLRSLVSRVRS